jgi:predicted alpha/beta-hydrolase family hydrolase
MLAGMENPPSVDDSRVIVFAHGAGASSQSAWMRAWCARLSSLAPTIAFDYPYMQQGSRLPDPLPKLVASHREAVADARARHGGAVVLAGKSMGSRVGCQRALEDASVEALVCFGYPLLSAGKRPAVRDAVLLELRTPILFLQGTRDPLCPLDRLDGVRARMQAPSQLFTVEGGDHSLNVARATLRTAQQTQADVDAGVLAAVARFLASAPAHPQRGV